MARVLLALAVVGIMIYAVIDCLRSDDAEIRGMPKALWLLVIVALPLAGGVLWIALGRQREPGPTSPRPRTLGPDDDPDFLRSIDPPRPRERERRPDRGGSDAQSAGDEDDEPPAI